MFRSRVFLGIRFRSHYAADTTYDISASIEFVCRTLGDLLLQESNHTWPWKANTTLTSNKYWFIVYGNSTTISVHLLKWIAFRTYVYEMGWHWLMTMSIVVTVSLVTQFWGTNWLCVICTLFSQQVHVFLFPNNNYYNLCLQMLCDKMEHFLIAKMVK